MIVYDIETEHIEGTSKDVPVGEDLLSYQSMGSQYTRVVLILHYDLLVKQHIVQGLNIKHLQKEVRDRAERIGKLQRIIEKGASTLEGVVKGE